MKITLQLADAQLNLSWILVDISFSLQNWLYSIQKKKQNKIYKKKQQETKKLVLFRLGEAHRSKCALYDAKPPILVSQQLSHNETLQSYNVYASVHLRPHVRLFVFVNVCMPVHEAR